MAKYTKQIEKWAKIYSDTFVNESTEVAENDMLKGRKHNAHIDEAEDDINESTPKFKVDEKYINDALAELNSIKALYPDAYANAIKYLNYQKNNWLVVSAHEFAQKRINLAKNNNTNAPAYEPSTEDRRQELMDKIAQSNKELAPSKEQVKEQTIKSIWVKDLVINPVQDYKSVAKLQLEYMDGTKEDIDFNIGVSSSNRRDYLNADKMLIELKAQMHGATVKDLRLALVHVAFNDRRIKWFYGPNKISSNSWSFDTNMEKINSSPAIKSAKKSWLEKSTNRALHWQSADGKTKIYRTEAEKVDESILSFISNFNEKFSK